MNIKLFRLLTFPGRGRGISIVRVKNINRFLKLSDKIKLAEEIPTDPKDVFRIPPLYPLGEDSRLEEVWGAVKGGIIRNEIALNQRVIQSTAIYRSAGSKLWRNWNRRRPRCSAHDNSELGL